MISLERTYRAQTFPCLQLALVLYMSFNVFISNVGCNYTCRYIQASAGSSRILDLNLCLFCYRALRVWHWNVKLVGHDLEVMVLCTDCLLLGSMHSRSTQIKIMVETYNEENMKGCNFSLLLKMIVGCFFFFFSFNNELEQATMKGLLTFLISILVGQKCKLFYNH